MVNVDVDQNILNRVKGVKSSTGIYSFTDRNGRRVQHGNKQQHVVAIWRDECERLRELLAQTDCKEAF